MLLLPIHWNGSRQIGGTSMKKIESCWFKGPMQSTNGNSPLGSSSKKRNQQIMRFGITTQVSSIFICADIKLCVSLFQYPSLFCTTICPTPDCYILRSRVSYSSKLVRRRWEVIKHSGSADANQLKSAFHHFCIRERTGIFLDLTPLEYNTFHEGMQFFLFVHPQ